MIKDEKKIVDDYRALQLHWDSKYERPSKLLELHSKPEAMKRILEFFEFIQKHVDYADTVAVMASSDPIGLCHLLTKYYGSDIKIVSDHPLLDRTKWFYEEKYSAEVIELNPMYEDASKVVADCDLVVFPEYEFFAPMSLVKPYGDKLTAALHYVINPCPGNSTFTVESVEDLLSNLSFSEVVASGEFKGYDGKKGFFSLGSR